MLEMQCLVDAMQEVGEEVSLLYGCTQIVTGEEMISQLREESEVK